MLNDQNGATIATLSLAGNQLTDKCATQIIEIVQICKINYLNMSDNTLGNIFPYFEHYTITTLEELNISCNDLKDNAVCLGQQLHVFVNLKILDITKNNIPDKAAASLTTGLLLTYHLEEFKYDDNLFSEDSIMVFEMIHQLRTISDTKLFECAPSKVKALVFILNCINDNEEMVQSSDIVSTIGLITELNLSHIEPTTTEYKLTSEDSKELCTVLRWFKKLEVLDVSNNKISIEAKELMTKAMLQIHTLNNIKLNGNPISDDKHSVAVFDNITKLRENKLQSIIFNQKNSCHVESIIYIMECLKKFIKVLNCFKLFYDITIVNTNSESSYGAKFLEHLDFLPFLKHLKINHVESITGDGISQLSKYLLHNTTLTTLDLSYCDLGDLQLENGPPNIDVKVLKLNHCNITDELLFQLFQNVVKFFNLDELEIDGNCFGDKGISHLHDIVLNDQNDATITTLSLAGNQLTDKCATQILEIIQICKVKYLNMSDNNLGSIFTHSEHYTITTLEELNVSCNDLKDNAMLGQQLHVFVNLKILDITNNDISDKATASLSTGLLLTYHLEEFKYDNNLFSEDSIMVFEMIHQL